MEKRPIKSTPFHLTIIPTFATPVASQSPKPSLLDSTIRWLVSAVTRLALSRRTVMIDRALAEDLAAAFEVDIQEVPLDISGVIDFVCDYAAKHAETETVALLTYRLQVVSGRLCDLIDKMNASPNG